MRMIRSSNNGSDFIIPKGAVALLTLLIVLISTVATVVAIGVTVKADVQHNTETIYEIKSDINDIEKWAKDSNTQSARMDTRLDNIEKSLEKIDKKLDKLR